MFRRLLIAAAVLVAASSVDGATPTIDQLLSMRGVSSPRISPDGRRVAYAVGETDWKENAYVTHLWLADVKSGRSFQLTRGKKSTDSAQWSPDGRWLAFMAEREASAIQPLDSGEKKDEKTSEAKPATRQIWLISPEGGEAWQLTKHGASIDSYRWSNDSKRIAFAAPVPDEKKAKDRKEKYSDYEVFEEDYEQNQLWTADVAAAEKSSIPVEATRILAQPRINVDDIEWSPDDSLIAFTATDNPLLSYGGSADVWIVDLAHGNSAKKVVALDGPDRQAVFSPDGSRIAFSTSLAEPYFFYANEHIATVSVSDVLQKPAIKPADVNDLTASFDEDARLLDWGRDGIYFRAQQKTASHLFCIDPEKKTIVRVTSPDDFYLGDASFTRTFDTIAFTAADSQRVTELYASKMPAKGQAFGSQQASDINAQYGLPSREEMSSVRRLTDMNAQYAGLTLGTAEVVSWKSTDGATIEGILHKPANYDRSKRYPLLVVIHGGPTGVSRPVMAPANRYYPIELFLAKGALVLEPNYRGSAGYGSQFRALNVRNLGIGDMWDVMSGVDSLIARGIVDPERMGSMGWSQGGYISAFLTTNTDRFKAISVGAGISDWTTYYVNTDITPFTRQYLKATPWEDPKVYADTSPITNIRKAKTPTLIQHGEKDKRVPPPNAFELYRGLRDVGVPARLIVYAGFGHGITKPKSNRAVLQHNLDWFGHYVFGDPFPKDSPLFGSGEAAGEGKP